MEVHGEVVRKTDRPPPESFEEVGDRLNRITADLNSHEEALGWLRTNLGNKIAEAREEATCRHAEMQAAVDEEIERRLLERKQEGILIGAGILLQFVGAAVIVAC